MQDHSISIFHNVELGTSSPTTDAFSRDFSSYASLTGVQLTRVVSSVNKRAPSNGERVRKMRIFHREDSSNKLYEDPNFRRIREAFTESTTRVYHFTFPRDILEEREKKKRRCSLAHWYSPNSFKVSRTLIQLSNEIGRESDGTIANNRFH